MKTRHYLLGFAMALAPAWALAEQAPSFQQPLLTIPRVDTESKAGHYQNAQFKLAEDGRWDLLGVTEAQSANLETSDVVVIDSKPVQAFAKATGYLPSGCYGLGSIHVRQGSSHFFEVTVNQLLLHTFAACTQALVPFSVTVPLEVYGLAAGTYHVSINDRPHSFVLATDNYLPE